MHRVQHLLQSAVLVLLAAVSGPADASDADPIPQDHYRMGQAPVLERPVLGDLGIAGLRPHVRARVAADLLASGGWLQIDEPIGDDLRAAAVWLDLNAAVGDHAALGGWRVHLAEAADIHGRSWIAGQSVHIDGRTRGPLHVAGQEVVIAGRIDGPTRIHAQSLRILAGARIRGDLVYRAPTAAEVEPGAQVDGSLTFHRAAPRMGPAEESPAQRDGIGLLGLLAWTAALLIPGLLLRLLVPGFTHNGERALLTEPLLSLGIGGLLLVVLPLAGIVLCVFVLTIPLVLATLAALVPLALVGYLLTAGALGDRALARLVPAYYDSGLAQTVTLATALAGLTLAGAIPYLGGLIALTASLFGSGATAVTLHRRLRATA